MAIASSHNDGQRNELQVNIHHQRTNKYVTCYACGGQGHYARNCSRPNLPRLWPFIPFDTFQSPPEQAWAEGEVEAWFRCVGPAVLLRQVLSFKELVKDLFPNFQPSPLPASSHSSSPTNSASTSSSSPTSSSPGRPLRLCASTATAMANIPIDPAPFVP